MIGQLIQEYYLMADERVVVEKYLFEGKVFIYEIYERYQNGG